MTRKEVHDLMENELRCVQRGNYCDRDCAKCPLVKDDKELIEAYEYVIKALEQEPIKPMVEIDLYSVIKQKYIEREVLDKIRAEIRAYSIYVMPQYGRTIREADVLHIIDKYKAETEAEDGNDD